jgi:hypothetical protein
MAVLTSRAWASYIGREKKFMLKFRFSKLLAAKLTNDELDPVKIVCDFAAVLLGKVPKLSMEDLVDDEPSYRILQSAMLKHMFAVMVKLQDRIDKQKSENDQIADRSRLI